MLHDIYFSCRVSGISTVCIRDSNGTSTIKPTTIRTTHLRKSCKVTSLTFSIPTSLTRAGRRRILSRQPSQALQFFGLQRERRTKTLRLRLWTSRGKWVTDVDSARNFRTIFFNFGSISDANGTVVRMHRYGTRARH